ncbi:hypothetical protein BI364_15130 [Acidihalobacter yilgarnensis]|uniref:Cytochrome c domain-containing protein n=1 Tax=Acidihalobacter yilgarnensis TaxID=2819280 RepID=A0A1D8IRK6_9GAMM|nr:c-type cytochrome [Acidihalobacter yilgarnensis]AOU99096.1 hypothetical protein BI364_15130 [Acidihalobacter yilgarnensis]
MISRWKVSAALAVFLFAGSQAYAAGNPAIGQRLSTTCAACHGASGSGLNPQYPNLAGQNFKYLVKQLTDFKDGRRKNAIMNGMTAKLSAEDIDHLAAFFASQTPRSATGDQRLVKMGEAVYRGGDFGRAVPACMACHAPNGVGNAPAGYPRLGGQHAEYVVSQLEAFARGTRDNDPNQMMRDIASRMSEQQMRAVAQYIQGLY